MRILYTKSDGVIFNPVPAEDLTPKELELIESEAWGLMTVDDVKEDAIKAGRYVVSGEAVQLLPEELWPENQVIEEIE